MRAGRLRRSSAEVERLRAAWQADAESYGVFPIDDRNLMLKLVQDRQ